MKPSLISILVAAQAAAAVTAVGSDHQIMILEGAASEQGFAAAVQEFGFLGREQFANSTLAPMGEQNLGTHTLAPGTSAPTFPGGTNTTLGLMFQSNSLGGSPVAPNPGGTLYASGSAVGDAGMIRIGPEATSNSLDIFVDPPDFRGLVRGIAFSAFQEGGADAVVRLYSSDNVELANATVSGLGVANTKRIGLLAPEGETIFRINYWVPGGFGDIGEVELYAIPEPATVGIIFSAAALALAVLRRRRRTAGNVEAR